MIRRPPRSTLFLHDALPISVTDSPSVRRVVTGHDANRTAKVLIDATASNRRISKRSEEHTSELQSPCNLVCRLLLEKKKNARRLNTPILGTRTRCDDRHTYH